MGDWDIGLAMVASRLASSGTGREQMLPAERATQASDRSRWGAREKRRRSLPGVRMEAIEGNLLLVPCVDPPKQGRPGGWTPTRKEGSVVHIGKDKIMPPPGDR